MKYFIIACVNFLIIACSVSNEKSDASNHVAEAAQDSLTEFINAYYNVMSERDWSTYRNYFWDDAIITTVWMAPSDSLPGVMVTSIDEFIAQTPNGPDSQPIFEERMTSMRADRKGNLAVVWADYQAKFGTEEKLMTWNGTDLFCLMYFNDEWKIVSLTFEAEQ